MEPSFNLNQHTDEELSALISEAQALLNARQTKRQADAHRAEGT